MKYHCDRPLVPFLGLDPAIRHSAGRLVGRSSEPSRRQPAECACVRLERYRERKTERPGSCTQRYKCTTRCFQIPYSSIRLACSASSLLVIASLIDEYKACLLQTKKSCRWIYIRREFCAKHDKAALWLCTSSTSQMFGTGGAALARFKIKCCTPIVCQERCTIMSWNALARCRTFIGLVTKNPGTLSRGLWQQSNRDDGWCLKTTYEVGCCKCAFLPQV